MTIRVCFFVDARSPIACGWIKSVAAAGVEAHVISTFPADSTGLPVRSFHVVPVAFSGLAQGRTEEGSGRAPRLGGVRLRGSWASLALNTVRRWVGPLDVFRHVRRVRRILDEIRPDLVHAMRIPYEGLLATEALASTDIPLLVSIWGNDFTLHAARSWPLSIMTGRAMARADALHADCERDVRLACLRGFPSSRPHAVLPGNGGLDVTVFSPGAVNMASMAKWQIPTKAIIILNPRGMRAYVRNDTFFKAIPLVLRECPDAHFACVGMAGNRLAEKWVQDLDAGHAVTLLPPVSVLDMRDLFRAAPISVSPSEHDGTPNTLLEAMACGSFPVAGDLDSVREWIRPGENGFLCDPSSPSDLAQKILCALKDRGLRQHAVRLNTALITKKAECTAVRRESLQLYRQTIEQRRLRV